jgi:GT2 family glycosyltransferase
MNKVYIVIPVHNRIEKTLQCLRSIYSQDYKDIHVIVVDDGSSDSTQDKLNDTYPQATILPGTGSLFWTGAVNFGINYVLSICQKGDWILLVNNDVKIENDVIGNLVSFLNNLDRKAIVNALSVDSRDKDTIVKSGTVVKSWLLNRTYHVLHGSSLSKLGQRNEIEVDLLTGRCLLHPVEIFKDIGNYNSSLFPHYGGDDEFSARAKLFGYKLFVLPTAIVYLEQEGESHKKQNILQALFGMKSNINIINKWRLTRAIVPLHAKASYYLISIFKSLYIFFKNK